MGAAVDPAFESLHRLRIRGLVPVEQLPDATALAQQSLVIVAERGCMLTAEGLQRTRSCWRSRVRLSIWRAWLARMSGFCLSTSA